MSTVVTVGLVLVALVGVLLFAKQFLVELPNKEQSTWVPSSSTAAKREYEDFALKYTIFWIFVFAVVIICQLYEKFDENSYMKLCVSLAAPLLLQPFFAPMPAEKNLPVSMRYSFKANVWLAIFSFIGNYWYTHYFYTVLKAKYTFPSHRLNDVPVALFFATHFYFVTYHTFANMLLRKIETTFVPSVQRTMYFWLTVFSFSYFTAYMETLTISSFPYYSFEDRDMVYTIGSAFYGIYFMVSYPVFYRLDEKINAITQSEHPYSLFQTVMEAMGSSMIVLLLLDFCRLGCGIALEIPGVGYYLYKP